MAGEQVESLVREYRGWRYVIDDLFAADAARLAEGGWRVASTTWRDTRRGGWFWLLLEPLFWRERLWDRRLGTSRDEFVLTVTYERP